MVEPVTDLGDDLREALTERCLLARAATDAFQAMLRHVVIGRTTADAIIALNRLREIFEERAKP